MNGLASSLLVTMLLALLRLDKTENKASPTSTAAVVVAAAAAAESTINHQPVPLDEDCNKCLFDKKSIDTKQSCNNWICGNYPYEQVELSFPYEQVELSLP